MASGENFGSENINPSEISLKIARYYLARVFKKAQVVFSAISLPEKYF